MKVIVALLLLIGAAAACSCISRPFCAATTDTPNLEKAVVTAVNVTGTTTHYAVNVSDVIKGVAVTVVTTATSSATCGVAFELGVTYLIGTDAAGNANLCGPTRPWASLTPDERRVLKRGGLCDDCSTLKCAKHQECKTGDDGAAYCADVCAKGRCKAGETCTLTPVQCVRAPCPPVAVCTQCAKTCTLQYAPVCGSDGKTYGNDCALTNAICTNPALVKAYDGECKPRCNRACPLIRRPVCATNGKTYGNDCLLGIAICRDPTLKKAHDGECKKPDCNMPCAKIYAPVCGSDGNTYGNDCLLAGAICRDPTLKKAYDGECKKQDCNQLCPQIYAPVCGSDGKTYGNDCMLGAAICRDPTLSLAHAGECNAA